MRPAESFNAQPVRSLQTMLRVIALQDDRHESLVPDGIYGPETLSAISTFQRLHGLPVTGITDNDTWDAVVRLYDEAVIEQDAAHPLLIDLNPRQVIRRGERHPHMYLVQAMLTVLAEEYSSIGKPDATGILDDATYDAIAAFQEISGLPMTGTLDKHTWKHLALQYPLAATRQTG